MLVNAKEMLCKARREHYAVPSTNFVDWLTAETYVTCAEKKNLPLILSFAESHIPYLSLEEASEIGRYFANRASVPVVLHLDHGTDQDLIFRAMDLGFTSVMIDASQKTFEENVAKTKAIVEEAHARGVTVEAELGHVGSNEIGEAQEITDSIYTEAKDVVAFVEQTQVDSLAISIGTSHGLYHGEPHIHIERLKEIAEVTDIPLVLHGGSSSGYDNLEQCALNGIAKINIYTDFVVAAKKALNEGGFADYFDGKDKVRAAVEAVLAKYYDVFHTA